MKSFIAACSLLSLTIFSSDAFAKKNEIAARLDLSSRNFIIEPKENVGGFPGKTAEVLAKKVPVKPSCVAQIDTPELFSGYTSHMTHSNTGREQDEVVEVRGSVNVKSCRFKLLLSYGNDQYLYGYREISTSLNLDTTRNVSFGPQFGLGMFGQILSVLTLGISDTLIDSANNIKQSLEYATSSALSKKVPVQNIVSELTMLLCEVEAAKLAKSRTCKDSNVVDHSDYVSSLRGKYLKFISQK